MCLRRRQKRPSQSHSAFHWQNVRSTKDIASFVLLAFPGWQFGQVDAWYN